MITATEKKLRDERIGVIGGSDVGALWNLDFGCRRKLAYEKSGRPADFQEMKRPEFERGHYVEPVVARLYADKTMRKVELAGRERHPEHSHMVVHMDRIVTAPDKAGPGYLEIKVVNPRTFKKFKTDGLYESYILQVQHGLAVTGLTWGSYAVLCLEPWQFAWFDVESDQAIIERLITDEKLFMEEIKGDFENSGKYQRLTIGDKRCFTCSWRQTCRGSELDGLLAVDERDAELVDMPDLLPIAAELQELKQMQDDLDAMKEEANAGIMAAIEALAKPGDNGGKVYPPGVKYPGGKSYRIQPSGSRKWDSKALWGLYDNGTDKLKDLLGKYCNHGKIGKQPAAFLRHYWTGDK